MEEYLTVALVHLNVRYKHVVENRRTLLQLNKEAAQKGADIILNTELALSGYSFRSREEVYVFQVVSRQRRKISRSVSKDLWMIPLPSVRRPRRQRTGGLKNG